MNPVSSLLSVMLSESRTQTPGPCSPCDPNSASGGSKSVKGPRVDAKELGGSDLALEIKGTSVV